MPKAAELWSLTSLREKLIKIGAKVVSHGRYVTFQLAEVAVSRQIFARHPVADRPTAGTARASMSGRREQMRQVATAEVCVGMRKPEQFSVLLPSTAGFERPLPVQDAICCCPSRSQAQSWPRSRGIWQCLDFSGPCSLNSGSRAKPALAVGINVAATVPMLVKHR